MAEVAVVDSKCGSTTRIDGRDAFTEFSADLEGYEYISGDIDATYDRHVGQSGWLLSQQDVKPGNLQVTFLVYGSNRTVCSQHVSKLVAACKNCIISIDEDGCEYVSVLVGVSVIDTKVPYYDRVQLSFASVKRLPLVTVNASGGSTTITNVGDVASGMRLTITAQRSLSSAVVCGITVKNLSSGSQFIIDGLEGTVMCNGINRFLDTDLIDFPKIQPGSNRLTFDSGVSLKIEYYPILIV